MEQTDKTEGPHNETIGQLKTTCILFTAFHKVPNG